MRHRKGGKKLSRPTGHRLALYRNLITDLLRYEKVITTQAKAEAVQGLAEKVITLGKEGSLTSRRQASSIIRDKKVLDRVFNELAKRYSQRPGGYTRIIKLGQRVGDGAPLAQLELVE